MTAPRKELGQHWLFDEHYLRLVVDFARLQAGEAVLEIGPGLGSLTELLLAAGGRVSAVELDEKLYVELLGLRRRMLKPDAERLDIIQGDILRFDLSRLPEGYKVVANIPYYLTGQLLRNLTEAPNPPRSMTLLLQKEVAERLAAEPGKLSILAVHVQLFGRVELGDVVPAKAFSPPPKVDSRIVRVSRHNAPLFPDLDRNSFSRLVKAGFGERRKKLRSSLAGGLHMDKVTVDAWLARAGLPADARAQELSLEDWYKLWHNQST